MHVARLYALVSKALPAARYYTSSHAAHQGAREACLPKWAYKIIPPENLNDEITDQSLSGAKRPHTGAEGAGGGPAQTT